MSWEWIWLWLFPQYCPCESVVTLCRGEFGKESSLVKSVLCGIFFKCFFPLRTKIGRSRRDYCFFLCTSFSEERYFSEDSLNNMSLHSQLEWFNCFWIHTGGMLCKGQKAIIWMSLLHLCSVVASEVLWGPPFFWSGGGACSRARVSLFPDWLMLRTVEVSVGRPLLDFQQLFFCWG